MKRLAELFWTFFCLSLFVVGGGYAIVSVANETLHRKGWLDEDELIDRLPVFQSLPGILAAHTAVYVGYRRAHLAGAIVSVVAVALPAVVLFTAVTAGYHVLPIQSAWFEGLFLGLRASLTGIVAATVLRSWKRAEKGVLFYGIVLAGTFSVGFCHVPVALVLVLAALLGLGDAYRPSGRHFAAEWLPILLFMKYGALGFGGGFVLVPMYLEDFVGAAAPYLQMSDWDFQNVMALSQMTPGPIGINAATYFGYRFAGAAGAALASVALLLPGFVVAFAAFRSYDAFSKSRFVGGLLRGLRPASIALMAVALSTFVRSSCHEPLGAALAIACAVAAYRKMANVIVLIALCGLVGVLWGLF